MEEEEEEDNLLYCPSFNSYTSHSFAKIADEVNESFGRKEELKIKEEPNELEVEDDGFEFSSLNEGQFRPNFPIFDRRLLNNTDQNRDSEKFDAKPVRRNQLKNLFCKENDERESSCSLSSKIEELEGVPSETYCIWRPKSIGETSQKSSSTGSGSKRWNFRDLILRRSHSDVGKDAILTSSSLYAQKKKKNKVHDKNEHRVVVIEGSKQRRNSRGSDLYAGKVKVHELSGSGDEKLSPSPVVSASLRHDVLHVRNRALKEYLISKNVLLPTDKASFGTLIM